MSAKAPKSQAPSPCRIQRMSGPGELLRSGHPVLQRSREVHRLPGRPARADSRLQQRLSLRLPAAPRRRRDRSDPCMARRAQPPQDAGQGRHPLQPRGLRRGGHGAGRADDLQVRDRRRAVWRREGRHQDRAEGLFARRARAHHAPLRARAHEEGLPRPRHRRAGARLRHRRARDGVDGRHLCRAQSRAARCARLRHRQAGHPGRRARTQGSHRPRPVLRASRSLQRA